MSLSIGELQCSTVTSSSTEEPSSESGYSRRDSISSVEAVSVKQFTLKQRLSERGVSPAIGCPRQCEICGAKATGYHYEVASCNSCKTFFRRNVLETKPAVCKFSSQCHKLWPTENRRMCRACRFQRCLEKGMDPETLHYPEDQKRTECVVVKKPHLTSLDVISPEQRISQLIDQLMYLEIKSDLFRASAYNPNPRELPPLEEMVEQRCSFFLADRLGPMPNWPLPTSQTVRWDQKSSRKQWLVFDLLGSLEYAKTFGFFHKLLKKDKVVLMKAVGLMCYNLTQAFFSYSNKSDALLRPDGSHFPEPSTETGEVGYRISMAKRETIAPLMRTGITRAEYVIVKAILLCNASVPNLSSEAVKILAEEKQRLNEALCTYCLNHFGQSGPARYAADLAVIANLEHLTNCQKDYMLLMSIKFKAPHLLFIKFVEEMFN